MNITSVLIVLIVAVPAFAIAAFARLAGSAMPPADIFPVFAVLTLLQSLAFGAGVAYVVRQRHRLFGAGTPSLERAVAWCVAYLLLAPWPHDYLHAVTLINGVFNWPGLAAIEYVFHLGIAPVGVLVGAYLMRARDASADRSGTLR